MDNNGDGHEGKEGAAPPLMDVPALAKRLSVPERHVRRLVAENRVPYLKWGHLVRFDPRQIEKWFEAAQVLTSPTPVVRSGRARLSRAFPQRSPRFDDDVVSAGIVDVVKSHVRGR